MKREHRALLNAWITVIIWSFAYIFTKVGLRYFDAFSLSVFRYLAAGVAVLIILIFHKDRLPALKDLPLIILLGLTGFTLYVLTFNYGSKNVSVATSSVIIASAPVTTALAASIFFHEKLTVSQVFATIIEFIGVVIVCLWDGILKLNSGVFWIVLSMLCFTAYNILARLLVKKYNAMQITEYSLLTASLTFVFLSPAAFARTKSFSLIGVVMVILMGVVCSGLAYVCWAQAMKDATKTADVSNILFAEPVITSLLGFVFLKELPDLGTIIGGVIILIGLILFSSDSLKK